MIFWVRGGAYIGGDKADITEYAVQIANEGYVVVNMNYKLAPGAKYPTPLHQLDEAYAFILGHEYQFIMNTPQAENTFREMIHFLNASESTMHK